MYLSKTTFFFLHYYLGLSNAFGPSTSSNLRISSSSSSLSRSNQNTFLTMSSSSSDDSNNNEEKNASNSISGSFFNPVPPQSKDNDEDNKSSIDNGDNQNNDVDPFDSSMLELMRKRSKKPLASQPSTVGGVPTSQAKGFGKPAGGPQIINTTKTIKSLKKSFVGIGKPLNDINKPEYDDQGYTLYADEETGKKSRVFEALVDYPCDFKLKIIGANEGTFASEMVQVVADSCNVDVSEVKYSERMNGKWMSVTVFAPVESAEMLYALYENIDRDPRVKFKF